MDGKCYGLLGRKLGHSWSVPIHQALGCPDYRLIELEPDALEAFLRRTDIGGLNVTIPYKRDVMPYCDEIDAAARAIGSVNTIVRRPDGKLCAYNTDAAGFCYMARRAGISFAGRKAVILGSVTWSLDGTIQPDFYSSDEADALGLTGLSFLPFEQVRPQCFDLIKGKRTPSYFKFVFLLSPKNLERTLLSTHSSFTPEDITGMFINLKFQQKKLLLTTGISYRIFSVDKSLDQEWDSLVKRFLTAHEISFEEL